MEKETLGIILIPLVIANFYWAARIYTLMRFEGTPQEVAASRKKARRFSAFSKVSYLLVLVVVAVFYFFKGK